MEYFNIIIYLVNLRVDEKKYNLTELFMEIMFHDNTKRNDHNSK